MANSPGGGGGIALEAVPVSAWANFPGGGGGVTAIGGCTSVSMG